MVVRSPPKFIKPKGPDPADVQAGQRIRARRLALKTSQSDLADAIGVSFQQVQKYERGINRVSLSMLLRIAAALDCAPVEFLPGPGRLAASPAQDLIGALIMTHGGHALAQAFLAMDPPRRRALINVAAAMSLGPPAGALDRDLEQIDLEDVLAEPARHVA